MIARIRAMIALILCVLAALASPYSESARLPLLRDEQDSARRLPQDSF